MEHSAERGNAIALQELQGPECPDSLRYLLSWLYEVHGRSGVSVGGMGAPMISPLTWGTIGEWSRLTGIAPEPQEINALFLLDATMLNPAEPKKDAK